VTTPIGRLQLVERMLADLRAFSPELVDPGALPAATLPARLTGAGIMAGALRRCREFAGLVPNLVREAHADERDAAWEEHATRLPVHARLSRRAADWTRDAGRLVPARWSVLAADERPDPRALAWLAGILDALEGEVHTARTRAEALRDEAALPGEHDEAEQELQRVALGEQCQRLDAALAELGGARAELHRAAGTRIVPSARLPQPYPSGPAWTALARSLREGTSPLERLRGALTELLRGEVVAADVPWLYQRWCGLQLLLALARAGARVRSGNVLEALYASGRIDFTLNPGWLSLFVEPLLKRGESHASGYFACRGSEASPDFLIVVPGPQGTDAFVLDATLSTNEAALRAKFRYLTLLASVSPVTIAGTATQKPPARAWALAPLVRAECDLKSADGSTGIVPMSPLRWMPAGLEAWLQDVVQHARAWGPTASSRALAATQ
jgi:hypothetical protein